MLLRLLDGEQLIGRSSDATLACSGQDVDDGDERRLGGRLSRDVRVGQWVARW
jgi:hypothetical protein